MRKCLTLISDTSVPLFDELKKWVRKFSMCCDLLDYIYTAKKIRHRKTLINFQQNLKNIMVTVQYLQASA